MDPDRPPPGELAFASRIGRRSSLLPKTVRGRATLGAMVVVGLALAAGAIVLLIVLRAGYVDSVRNPAQARANDLAVLLSRGTQPEVLDLEEGSDRFTQIVAADRVVAASANLGASDSLENRVGVGVSVPVSDADDEWVVVTAPASTGRTVVVGRELDPPLESVGVAAAALAVGLPLILGLVGLTTWRVVGAALGPVEAIRSEVASLSATDLDRRVPVPASGDEIEHLAITMNGMLDRLDSAQRRQRQFVSDASHELRSPLAAIRQHAEVAQAYPGRTSLEALVEIVLEEESNLEQLVDDLLLLARADEGRIRSRVTAVDLNDVVSQEVERSVRTDVHVDTSSLEPAPITGDGPALRRAIRNLLDNANRHAASRVRVGCGMEDGWVVLTVDDDGPGIPASARPSVLERFTRLDHARSAAEGGAGLGLAIVAEVVAAHDGEVVIGESPLGGASIAIRLPIRPS